MWIAIEIVYVVGVFVGLLATDGGLAARIGTVAGLLVVAAIAFPVFGVALAALVAAAWLSLR